MVTRKITSPSSVTWCHMFLSIFLAMIFSILKINFWKAAVIWWFPRIGAPLKPPFLNGIFHEISHPSSGYFHFRKSPFRKSPFHCKNGSGGHWSHWMILDAKKPEALVMYSFAQARLTPEGEVLLGSLKIPGYKRTNDNSCVLFGG